MARNRDLIKLRAYSKAHYEKNRPAMIARAKAHRAAQNLKKRAYILEYKQSHPCVDCRERDPIVLDFDHRPGVEKLFNVANHNREGVGFKQLCDEIEKCDVRCANCHRRKTHADRTAAAA